MGKKTLKAATPPLTYKIVLTGVVQGVGFRPFAANLAAAYSLTGAVMNTGSGVEIEVTGEEGALRSFAEDLEKKHPPRAHIAEIVITRLPTKNFDGFHILPSMGKAGVVFVPVDTAVCPECERELFDPSDRRCLYPFINCTQCGPRYTIIQTLPYDRRSTSMAEFPMCGDCEREYNDPQNRRFHAQPDACPVCGPEVCCGELKGTNAIKAAAESIDSGKIIAVKGLGGYHLICDASNAAAVNRLRSAKNRPTKPLALMCREIPADLPEAARLAANAPPAPIVITRWDNPPDEMKAALKEVNPLGRDIGFMQAYTPLHKVLLSFTKTRFIIATSGNIKNEPIIADNAAAERELSGIADQFLHHNRPILNPIDDSVAMYAAGEVRLLRRGRGYAPFPTKFPKAPPRLFAAGAHLKSSLTLTAGEYAFVSPFIGDTDSAVAQNFYRQTYENMKRLVRSEPEIAVADMHPEYFSARFAASLGIPVIRLQHHHAHLFSVMAEHRLTGDTVGVIMDGTGFGTDGAIWGGEVFVFSGNNMERAAHIERVPQQRGNASQRYPSLMAVSWLISAGVWDDSFWRERLGASAELAGAALKADINTIPTTSAGRLCESVGALILGIGENEYEAHAAMALEAAAGDSERVYPFDIEKGNIIFSPAVKALCGEIKEGKSAAEVSAVWHNTFAAAVANAGMKAAKAAGIKDIALSGGVFQNKRILERVCSIVTKAGFTCRMHREIPSNDGGISLGQAYYVCLTHPE